MTTPRSLAAALGVLALVPSNEALSAVRRFALVAGANDGGASRVRLRYATSDAEAISRVLFELGGVAQGDSLLLLEPDRARFLAGLDDLGRRVRAARTGSAAGDNEVDRLEVVLYYSGHSDEEGLLPSGERVSWLEVRKRLEALPADVRLAIVDACASGALLRSKGGVHRPPFLVDASSAVSGHAYLTSSSADEVAQESDRIGGSFFTHHLVSGLRGAADHTKDGRVTLSEVYQHAFHETLASSERTQKGPQHPNYDIDLAGSGDMVLTDLRHTAALLVLEPDLDGRLFVRDPKGRLVVELSKVPGQEVGIGLAAGRYHLALHDGRTVHAAEVSLGSGTSARMSMRAFLEVDPEVATARGDEPARVLVAPEPLEPGDAPTHRVRVSLVPYVAFPPPAPGGDFVHPFSWNLVGGVARKVEGLEMAGVFNVETESFRGVQTAGVANVVRGPVDGVQLAGVLNVAGDVDGFQWAPVNVARRVTGLQLGLLNVADHVDGESIGLLSFVGNGYKELSVWTGDFARLGASFKLGGPHVYTVFTAAGNPERVAPSWLAAMGFGGHLPMGRLYTDFDLQAGGTSEGIVFDDTGGSLLVMLRVALGLRLGRLHLWGGPTLNLAMGFDANVDAAGSFGHGTIERFEGDVALRAWPGFALGVGL